MKKYFFLLIGLSLFLTACDTGAAEKVADEFHKHFDKGEIDYICENMLDAKTTAEETEGFRSFLQGIYDIGEISNRKKSVGFSEKIRNGITTVKLNYTFEINGETVYESLVFVDRGEGIGFKLFVVSMNPDKSVVDEFTEDY
ncbi:MAG: hypothetical protein R2780_01890 [Crocinitomicaceae bacterium]|nr:hypothetical protein [Crocinitomicaceae bacterium]